MPALAGTKFQKSTPSTTSTVRLVLEPLEDRRLPAVFMPADVFPGKGSGAIDLLAELNGTAYFWGKDGLNGSELWRTDGTLAGTFMLRDINPGAGDSFPDVIYAGNGIVFFTATDPDHGEELWKTDGTVNGTELVKDINQGTGGSWTGGMIEINGTYYFSAANKVVDNLSLNDFANVELWRTDGTEAGTLMVKEINPSLDIGSFPRALTNFNGKLFFVAGNITSPYFADAAYNFELWTSDGTPGGTSMVRDIWLGNEGGLSGTPQLHIHNGLLIFTAWDSSTGLELWASNGTTGGTNMIKDINPGAPNSVTWNPQFFFKNGFLYFVAGDQATPHGFGGFDILHQTLWKTDGTNANTVIAVDTHFYDNGLFNINGNLAFERDRQLWMTDGTPGGTSLLHDFTTESEYWYGIEYWQSLGNQLFFIVDDGSHGFELWRTDGTVDGTYLVRDICKGKKGMVQIDYGEFAFLSNFEGKLYFQAGTKATYNRFIQAWSTKNVELWTSDGTELGTTLVKNIAPKSAGSYPNEFTVSGNKLFFTAFTKKKGNEVWVVDNSIPVGPERTARTDTWATDSAYVLMPLGRRKRL